MVCPISDCSCPYYVWGAGCSLATAKEDCDAWFGIEDEDEDEEDE